MPQMLCVRGLELIVSRLKLSLHFSELVGLLRLDDSTP
jgi:hypothetical protein